MGIPSRGFDSFDEILQTAKRYGEIERHTEHPPKDGKSDGFAFFYFRHLPDAIAFVKDHDGRGLVIGHGAEAFRIRLDYSPPKTEREQGARNHR